jgi:uracil phosphoribosyltransferase
MVHILGRQDSLIGNFIAELRDVNVQTDAMRFRRNLERIGETIAYEISKTLEYSEKEIETPLGIARCRTLDSRIVLGTILRAGIPVHNGMLNYFDRAENAIISAYRRHSSETSFDIQVEYMSSPSLEGKTLILCDPMLASGMSMVACYKILTDQRGTPKQTHIASVISSEQGLEYCRHNLPGDVTYWIGEVDPELNAKSYIVPGLGDAGDLAFGQKL